MDNNVLARVENIEITKQHLMNIIRSLPQQQMMEVSTVEGRKRLLDELVAGELFYLEAMSNNINEEEEFKKILEEANHNLLQRYAVQKLLEKVTVNEEDMKKYYEENKESFVSAEEVRAKHILVKEEEEAKKVKEEIEAGKSFEEAAKEYSTCPSKDKGGDLGFFSKGRMVPEFEKAAFELEIGELSDLVKTQFGYHLIVVEEKKESSIKTFDQVKEQIKQNLLRGEQTKVYTNKFNELKSKYSVEMNEDELK
ncbi:MAG: peptidylprolyl isomerase [Vallitalea sp.]|jgi:peptidyl-prolyl cis-trans isomerase C|nr:peptidylprolyl isomerase [Vallitalea sp.]